MKLVQYRLPFVAIQWDGAPSILKEISDEARARGYVAYVNANVTVDASVTVGELKIARTPWSYTCPVGHWLIFPPEKNGLPFILSDHDFLEKFALHVGVF